MDYQDTFSSAAKLTSVHILFFMAATHHWLLHQLDVKNAFINGVLDEEIYIDQPLDFVAQRESGKSYKLKKY